MPSQTSVDKHVAKPATGTEFTGVTAERPALGIFALAVTEKGYGGRALLTGPHFINGIGLNRQ
jgi:hypothetical protein